MNYYTYNMQQSELDALLQAHFDDNYGAVVSFNLDGELDSIEICKLTSDGRETVWTHYAYIFNFSYGEKKDFELSEGFIDIDDAFCDKYGEEYRKYIGTEQTAMHIYGHFKTLGGAVRNLAKYGTKRNPMDIYV